MSPRWRKFFRELFCAHDTEMIGRQFTPEESALAHQAVWGKREQWEINDQICLKCGRTSYDFYGVMWKIKDRLRRREESRPRLDRARAMLEQARANEAGALSIPADQDGELSTSEIVTGALSETCTCEGFKLCPQHE